MNSSDRIELPPDSAARLLVGFAGGVTLALVRLALLPSSYWDAPWEQLQGVVYPLVPLIAIPTIWCLMIGTFDMSSRAKLYLSAIGAPSVVLALGGSVVSPPIITPLGQDPDTSIPVLPSRVFHDVLLGVYAVTHAAEVQDAPAEVQQSESPHEIEAIDMGADWRDGFRALLGYRPPQPHLWAVGRTSDADVAREYAAKLSRGMSQMYEDGGAPEVRLLIVPGAGTQEIVLSIGGTLPTALAAERLRAEVLSRFALLTDEERHTELQVLREGGVVSVQRLRHAR